VDPDSDESTSPDAGRLEATWLQFEGLARRSEEAIAQARAIHAQVREGRSQREILHDSAYARLQARMESMPVIEQAKGIMMAECGWTAEQAFDALRQASQRENVKVRELAARIVARTAEPAGPAASQGFAS
jgi:hypothetical protein